MESRGQLLECMSDFLTTRRRRVVIDGHSSGWSEVTSGVPQGSILGPLLFLVYINDFPLAVKCNCGLFADDSILHRKVTSESDCEDLQTEVPKVQGPTPIEIQGSISSWVLIVWTWILFASSSPVNCCCPPFSPFSSPLLFTYKQIGWIPLLFVTVTIFRNSSLEAEHYGHKILMVSWN